MRDDDLDREGPEPLYRQLAERLAEQIESGTLRPGRPIPSELRLCDQYGISRDTARKAVRVLRDAGLVISVKGKGTYVSR